MRNEDFSLLRHIPDLSNISSGFGSEGEPSFSFQIPSRTQIDNEDLLLHENGGDFFRGANGEEFSLLNATPASSRHHQQYQKAKTMTPVLSGNSEPKYIPTFTSTSATVLVDSPKKNLLFHGNQKRNFLPIDDDDNVYSTPRRLAKLKFDLEVFSETERASVENGSMEAENLASCSIPPQSTTVATSTCVEQRAVESKALASVIDLSPVRGKAASADGELDLRRDDSWSNGTTNLSTVVGKQTRQKEHSSRKSNSVMENWWPEPEIDLPLPSSVPTSMASKSSKHLPNSYPSKRSVTPVPRAANPPTYNAPSIAATSQTSPSKNAVLPQHVSLVSSPKVNATVSDTPSSPQYTQANEANSMAPADLASHSSPDPSSPPPDATHEPASNPTAMVINNSTLETFAPATQDVCGVQTAEDPLRTLESLPQKEAMYEHPTIDSDAPVAGLEKQRVVKRGEGKVVAERGGVVEPVKGKEKEKRAEDKEVTQPAAKKSRLRVQSAIRTTAQGVDVRRKQALLDDLKDDKKTSLAKHFSPPTRFAASSSPTTNITTDLSATSQTQNDPDYHPIATSAPHHHTSATQTTLAATSKRCTSDTVPESSSPHHDAVNDREPEPADHDEGLTISQLSPQKTKPAPSDTQSTTTYFSAPDALDTSSPTAQVMPATGSRVSLGKRAEPSTAVEEVEGKRTEVEETERPPKKKPRLPSAGGHAIRPPPQLPSVGTRIRTKDGERQKDQPKQSHSKVKQLRGQAPTANAITTSKRAVDVGKKQNFTDSAKDDGERKRRAEPSSTLSLNFSGPRKPISSTVQEPHTQTHSDPEPSLITVGPTTTRGAITTSMESTSELSSELSHSHQNDHEAHPHLDLCGQSERDQEDPDRPLTVSQLSPRKLVPSELSSTSTSDEAHMPPSNLNEGGVEETDAYELDHHDECPGPSTTVTKSSSRSSSGKRARSGSAVGEGEGEEDGGSEQPRKKARVPLAAPRVPQAPPRTRGTVMKRIVSDSATVPISERLRARRAEKEAVKEMRKGKSVAGSRPVVASGVTAKTSGSVSTKRKAITNTKPFEFNFRTDSRAVEKAERQRQRSTTSSSSASASASTSASASAFTNTTASTSARTSTKPLEFNFQTDLRAAERAGRQQLRGASSLSSSSSTSVNGKLPSTFTSSVHKIPDYKTSHAQLDNALAMRKSQLAPVVPISMEMHTEVRAQQRAEFELVLKEKERKREEMEELRRQEEREEEEREVREIRRRIDEVNKARARPMPEWYYDKDKYSGGVGVEEVEKEETPK